MDIVFRNVLELTSTEYSACKRLNYRNIGYMYGTFQRDENQFVSIAKDGNCLLGWALAFKKPNNKLYNVYLYVRKSHRKQGIGTALLNSVRENINETLVVVPHDEASLSFFNKNKNNLSVDTEFLPDTLLYNYQFNNFKR